MPRDQTQVSREQRKHELYYHSGPHCDSQLSLSGHTMQSTTSIIPYHITFELT